MKIATNCKKCIFAHKAEDECACDLNIIDLIKDTKNIEVKEQYNYINDYICRFAFDKNTYESNISELEKIDIVKLLQDRSGVKYYLLIDIDADDDIDHICNKINDLTIHPKFLSFMIFNYEQTQKLIKTMTEKLNKDIQWKVHNFVEQEDLTKKIYTALETNKKANNSHYFCTFKGSDIDNLENYIMRINTIITIEQTPFHILMKSREPNIYGLFVSFDHYNLLKPLFHPMGIEELSKDPDYVIKYYV
jgi:hypothetical protein